MNWHNLNRMPKAFRQGTTLELKQKYADYQAEGFENQLDPKEANTIAEESQWNHWFEFADSRDKYYGVIHANDPHDWVRAQKYFKHWCTWFKPDTAINLMTIWDDGAWKQLGEYLLTNYPNDFNDNREA